MVVVLGAVWARGVVPDDGDVVVVAVGFLVDGGEGAEKQVAGVGHDGSTARSDAVVGLEKEESRKESVEVRGGGEFGQLAGEVAGEIGSMAFFLAQLGMPEAEMRFWVQDAQAAATTGDGTMMAER